MGWTFTHRPKGLSNKEFFGKEFSNGYEILDAATGSATPNHLFMAVRHPKGYVLASVYLTRWVPKDRSFNYGWKSMDETVGPVASDCPKRIMNLLTPLEEIEEIIGICDYARKWRKQVNENISRIKARGKLVDGMVVSAPFEMTFSSGHAIDEGTPFTVANAKLRHFSNDGWFRFRLTKQECYYLSLVTAETDALAA